MKKILHEYLIRFFREHVHIAEFVVALLFMAGFTYLRHGTDFLTQHWRESYYQNSNYLFFVILYGLPLAFGYISNAIISRDSSVISKPKLWLLMAIAILVFGLRSTPHLFFEEWMYSLRSHEHFQWFRSVAYTLIRMGMIMVPITVYWFLFDRKQPLYGFSLKGYTTRPYFMLLLMMVPLVILASTQGDFLGTYPRGKRFDTLSIEQMADWKYFGLYEFVYGIDFISIEFFFRGFLILAFIAVAGPRAILPMALMYMTIHWNKPAGEMISSFFGGTILGIITYYSRSIIGGIIIHMGLAWLMEIGALIGNFYRS